MSLPITTDVLHDDSVRIPDWTGLRRGLNQSGYVEGRNLVIEYRWGGTKLTGCQRWRLIWFNFEWLRLSHRRGYKLMRQA